MSQNLSFRSEILQHIPPQVSPNHREALCSPADLKSSTILYESLLEQYNHPYFMVRLAKLRTELRSDAVALSLYEKAQAILQDEGIRDQALDDLIQDYAPVVTRKAEDNLAIGQQGPFYQSWKPTREHKFPLVLPHPPPEHSQIQEEWLSEFDVYPDPKSKLKSKSKSSHEFEQPHSESSCRASSDDHAASSPTFPEKYLRKMAIDTNQLENVFLLTPDSAKDIIEKGFADGKVQHFPDSTVRDEEVTRGILNDTIEAFNLLYPLAYDPERITPQAVCDIHSKLTRTSRFRFSRDSSSSSSLLSSSSNSTSSITATTTTNSSSNSRSGSSGCSKLTPGSTPGSGSGSPASGSIPSTPSSLSSINTAFFHTPPDQSSSSLYHSDGEGVGVDLSELVRSGMTTKTTKTSTTMRKHSKSELGSGLLGLRGLDPVTSTSTSFSPPSITRSSSTGLTQTQTQTQVQETQVLQQPKSSKSKNLNPNPNPDPDCHHSDSNLIDTSPGLTRSETQKASTVLVAVPVPLSSGTFYRRSCDDEVKEKRERLDVGSGSRFTSTSTTESSSVPASIFAGSGSSGSGSDNAYGASAISTSNSQSSFTTANSSFSSSPSISSSPSLSCSSCSSSSFTPPTQTQTQTTTPSVKYTIQCCPYTLVNQELEYICLMGKQFTRTWFRNPIGTTSWLHLVLVRCHPFEDGNGRISRLVSSIPLLRYGYPPLSIPMSKRREYYVAINQSWNGDHRSFVSCILQSIRGTMNELKESREDVTVGVGVGERREEEMARGGGKGKDRKK